MKCQYCLNEIGSDAIFCPYCGKKIKSDEVGTFDFSSSQSTNAVKERMEVFCDAGIARCPNCSMVLNETDRICPRCKRKISYFTRMHEKDKTNFLYLLLSGLSYAAMFFPIIACILSLTELIFILVSPKKTDETKFYLILTIICLVISVVVIILGTIYNLKQQA